MRKLVWRHHKWRRLFYSTRIDGLMVTDKCELLSAHSKGDNSNQLKADARPPSPCSIPTAKVFASSQRMKWNLNNQISCNMSLINLNEGECGARGWDLHTTKLWTVYKLHGDNATSSIYNQTVQLIHGGTCTHNDLIKCVNWTPPFQFVSKSAGIRCPSNVFARPKRYDSFWKKQRLS